MLSRLARLLVIIAAVQTLGGHWMALQSVAWIGMIASYSQGEKLSVAIEKTFDGEHPCGLCKVVKEGRDQEKKQEVAKVQLKVDAVLSTGAMLPLPFASSVDYLPRVQVAGIRSTAPPTPPPLRLA